MQNINNFTLGAPRTPEDVKKAGNGVLFLFSESGQSWYDCQQLFSADTIKFTYDANGVIRSIDKDVSMLWPANLSVAEINCDAAPENFNIDGKWVYADGAIQPRTYTDEELKKQADEKKAILMTQVSAEIAPLERAVKLGIATPEETARLEELERYSVLLNRVDTSDPVWPVIPA